VSADSLKLLTAKGLANNLKYLSGDIKLQNDKILVSVFKQLRRFEQRSTPHAHKKPIKGLILSRVTQGVGPSVQNIITTGLDGFIKMHDSNMQTLKCYFVDPSGISKIVQLGQ